MQRCKVELLRSWQIEGLGAAVPCDWSTSRSPHRRLLLRANEAQHMRPAGEVGQASEGKRPLWHSSVELLLAEKTGVRSMFCIPNESRAHA